MAKIEAPEAPKPMETSLHTRYRPKSFDEVIGQTEIVKSLKRVIADQRAKAFIFAGPSGTGKTTLARITANAFSQGKATAANIQEIDAATNSGAEAVRAIVGRTDYRAVGASPVKAIILDEAHRLSSTAWDVLLKPIEEPPKHVYWFLCSTNPAKIPKTIQTRCIRYDLAPIKEDLILELIFKVADLEKVDVQDDVLEAIAEEAGGSPRQALVYLEACAYCEGATEARRVMRSAAQSKETIDLCRFLLKPNGRTWVDAMKLCKALEGVDAESIRITLVNYVTVALMGSKGEAQATVLLSLLECFLKPYQPSDKMAPLLHSIGLALNLDK